MNIIKEDDKESSLKTDSDINGTPRNGDQSIGGFDQNIGQRTPNMLQHRKSFMNVENINNLKFEDDDD